MREILAGLAVVLLLAGAAHATSTSETAPTAASTTAEAPYDDQAWSSPTNIYSDDTNTAYITHPLFDTNAYSEVIRAYTFDFSGIPAGATIEGVTVRINAFYSAGTADMVVCQLLSDTGALVGTNQCSTPVTMSSDTATIITKGSTSDTWGNSLTDTWVKDADFGVGIAVQATSADTDVEIDYVSMEIEYTEGRSRRTWTVTIQ